MAWFWSHARARARRWDRRVWGDLEVKEVKVAVLYGRGGAVGVVDGWQSVVSSLMCGIVVGQACKLEWIIIVNARFK